MALKKSGPLIFNCLNISSRLISDRFPSTPKINSSSVLTPRNIPRTNQQSNQTNQQKNVTNLSFPRTPDSRSTQRKLFTPDVLNVSDRVKTAMLATDPGIRHAEYIYAVDFLRSALLRIARASEEDFTVIPVHGSGSLAMESTMRTMLLKKRGKVIVLSNGYQGDEIVEICKSSSIDIVILPMDLKLLQDTLMKIDDVRGVVTAHCEWLSGLVNPVNEIGEIVKKLSRNSFFIVDGTVTFGSMPLNMSNVDFLVGDSCKSLQGAPGMAFVVARKQHMKKEDLHSDSLVMDLTTQYKELEMTGQLRFTPPIHIINALKEAILELSDEGGVEGRATRYKENNELVKKGMTEMGFQQFFTNEQNPKGFITIAYRIPSNPLFVIEEFRSRLNDYGFVISENRKLPEHTFCIGNIGNLYQEDVNELLQNIRQVCHDMRMAIPIREETY